MENNVYDSIEKKKTKLSSTCLVGITYFQLRIKKISKKNLPNILITALLGFRSLETKQSWIFQIRTNFLLHTVSAGIILTARYGVLCGLSKIETISSTHTHAREMQNRKSIRHNHWIMNTLLFIFNWMYVNCVVWSEFTTQLIGCCWFQRIGHKNSMQNDRK